MQGFCWGLCLPTATLGRSGGFLRGLVELYVEFVALVLPSQFEVVTVVPWCNSDLSHGLDQQHHLPVVFVRRGIC